MNDYSGITDKEAYKAALEIINSIDYYDPNYERMLMLTAYILSRTKTECLSDLDEVRKIFYKDVL